MMQVMPQTRDERFAMYMKMRKAVLVEMLMNNQDVTKHLIDASNKRQAVVAQPMESAA